MKKLTPILPFILVAAVAIAMSGCVFARSTTTRSVDPKGVPTVKTTSWGLALGDTRTSALKYQVTASEKYQGTTLNGLESSTTASNAPAIIEAVVSGAVQGAVKASAK